MYIWAVYLKTNTRIQQVIFFPRPTLCYGCRPGLFSLLIYEFDASNSQYENPFLILVGIKANRNTRHQKLPVNYERVVSNIQREARIARIGSLYCRAISRNIMGSLEEKLFVECESSIMFLLQNLMTSSGRHFSPRCTFWLRLPWSPLLSTITTKLLSCLLSWWFLSYVLLMHSSL